MKDKNMANGTAIHLEDYINSNGSSYGKGDRYTAAPNE